MEMNNVINDICSEKIKGKKVNRQPICILIGGLPGSGKTNLVEQVKAEHKERDFVVIDTDDYRKLHPDYEQLIKTPEIAVEETSKFSNTIEAELIKRAIQTRCDIISVTTLRATQAINEILYEPAINSGYEMEACVMAVSISESGLSAQNRYEAQIANGECPRFTPMSFIEGSFQGIRDTIEMIQKKPDRPTIKIYSRGHGETSLPIEIYNNKIKNSKYRCVLEALLNPRITLNSRDAAKQLKRIYELKRKRNANAKEYASLERLEELLGIERENNR